MKINASEENGRKIATETKFLPGGSFPPLLSDHANSFRTPFWSNDLV